MNREKATAQRRKRRRNRVRRRMSMSSTICPRLSIFRSHKHMYAQVVDDQQGKTLASVSTLDKKLRGNLSSGGNCEAATQVGAALAKRALAAGVTEVRFDRGEYKYHGRVAALADAARKAGLKF